MKSIHALIEDAGNIHSAAASLLLPLIGLHAAGAFAEHFVSLPRQETGSSAPSAVLMWQTFSYGGSPIARRSAPHHF